MLTMTINDVAKALNVTRPTIYKLIQDGTLKTFTIGRRRLATPDAVRACISAREKAGE